MSTPDHWTRFAKKWRGVLRDFGVREAKAADLQTRAGEFRRWDKPRVAGLRTALAAIISRDVLFGVTVSVFPEDYTRVIAAAMTPKDPFRDPYLWLMQSCLEFLAGELKSGDRAICVFDRGHHRQDRAERYFNRLVVSTGPLGSTGKILPSFRSADSACVAPLQGADLLAHGTRRGLGFHVGYQLDGAIHVEGIEYDARRVRVVGGWFDATCLEDRLDSVRAKIAELRDAGAFSPRT